jgi:hypothetical protein
MQGVDSMTLAEFGAVGELVGGLAVVVSLVYVGLQIRQSTNASRAATAQAFAKQYSDLNQMIADPELGEIFIRGLQGLGTLSLGEQASFMAIISSISRTIESFYFQKDKGELDARLFEGWLLQYLDLHANPGVAEFWRMRSHQYSTDFVEYLDNRLVNREPRPLYALNPH